MLFTGACMAQGDGVSFKSVNDCHPKKYSISVHILTDTLGAQSITQTAIDNGIAAANTHFAEICASFEICSTYVHPNVRNDTIRVGRDHGEIAAMYDVPNTINVYYAIEVTGSVDICGYATRGDMTVPTKTPQRDAIYIKKLCAGGITLTHELGYYFGLYRTFESNANGAELVDGSNCATAGDLMCDTKADPGPYQAMNGHCDLDPAQTDANGDYYTPNMCNIMSLGGACNDYHFTTEQYNRMLEVMEKGRNYLW